MVSCCHLRGGEVKIFMICDVALEGRDAQATHVLELFRCLSALNETRLFGPKPRHVHFLHEKDNIVFVPSIPVPFVRRAVYEILLFIYLAWYSALHRPHVFYVRYSIHLFAPVLVSLLFSIPLVLEVNGLPLDEIRMKAPRMGRGRRHLKLLSARLSERFNYTRARKIVAVTSNIKSYIEKDYSVPFGDVNVVANGVNTLLFKPAEKAEVRKRLKLDDGFSYVSFVGNLSVWQGVDCLINALPSILASCSNTRLLIVGDGELRKELMERAEKINAPESTVFIGSIAHESVPAFINASDVSVVFKRPLKSGYSPLKLYEYMACGIPVVASRLPGFEVVEKSNAGVLVDPGDTVTLAEAVIGLLKNEELRETMGRNGRQLVVQNHSWQKVAEKISDICQSARGAAQ